MTPRVILILKQAFSPLAEKIATTWRWELRERERVNAAMTPNISSIRRYDLELELAVKTINQPAQPPHLSNSKNPSNRSCSVVLVPSVILKHRVQKPIFSTLLVIVQTVETLLTILRQQFGRTKSSERNNPVKQY